MSYNDGISAMNLEMPERIPRTEYSAHLHWDLVSAVIGVAVNQDSEQSKREEASRRFIKAWDYGFMWNTLIKRDVFRDFYTRMGHAAYNSGGDDYDNQIFSPFEDPEDVIRFDPWAVYGQKDIKEITDRFNRNLDLQYKLYPDTLNMTGIYISCMSGLIEIFGWDMLLMGAGTDPCGFGEMTNRYGSWIMQYFEALAQSTSPIVMIHDDIVWTEGAFLAPQWYREFIFPIYKKLFAPLIENGKKILFTSDGNYTEFIDDIADTGVHGFVLEPATNMKYIAEKYGKTHVFVGNADTRVLMYGTREQIRAEVKRCIDIGKDCPGFFMSIGNHIPSNTPVENALYYNEVYKELSQR